MNTTSSVTMTGTTTGRSLLRRALLADSLISGAAALLLMLGAGLLDDPFGLSATFLRVVGLSLLPWTVLLAYGATRPAISRGFVQLVIGVNLLWIAGSILLLLSGQVNPTGLGTAFVIAQALAVLVFAELQIVGLRRGQAG